MEYRRVSADCHVDLPWLPPTLFVEQAPRELKDRMPHVKEGRLGPYWSAANGTPLGLVNGVGPYGAPFVPGKHKRVDAMAKTGLFSDGRKDIRRCTDPHLRIKDMELDGVDAEVLYGVLGASSKLEDREAANAMLRIYNDWLVEFCSHYPERHIGLACLPHGDIDSAVSEVHRVAKLGLRGLELSCSWDMQPMWDPIWEPLWEAVNEVNLPLHFHTFPASSHKAGEGYPPDVQRRQIFTQYASFQMSLVHILAALIASNVFGRYPNLRVVFGESGIGWIPYALERMDFEWEDRFTDLKLKMRPSEFWRQHCKATFQFDHAGIQLMDVMGAETLMWGSDYPHGDGIWPDSSRYIADQFANLSPEIVHKITCGNAVEFYRLGR